MKFIRRTLDIDADTDARLRELAAERGQDVSAVLAEAVALLDSVLDIANPDIEEDRRRVREFTDPLRHPTGSGDGVIRQLGHRQGISAAAAAPHWIDFHVVRRRFGYRAVREFLHVNNPEAAMRALTRYLRCA